MIFYDIDIVRIGGGGIEVAPPPAPDPHCNGLPLTIVMFHTPGIENSYAFRIVLSHSWNMNVT